MVMDVSERNGSSVGQNVVEMKFGNSDEFQKMKHLPFPCQAELGLRLTTKGYEVASFKALTPAKPASV